MASVFSFDRIRGKFFTLSLREQMLVLGVVAAFAYFCFDNLVYVPQSNRNTQLLAEHQLAETRVLALQAELSAAENSSGVLAKAQIENANLKQQLAVLNAVSLSVQGGTPQIGDLVRRTLRNYPNVKLASLKTQAPKTLIAPNKVVKDASGTAQLAARPLYKFAIELEMRGSYLDLLAYLQNLEGMTENVFWSDAKMLTLKYPESSLNFTIVILSDQPSLKIS